MIELIASERQQAFGAAKRETLPQFCLDCEVRFACHGGCPRNRFTRFACHGGCPRNRFTTTPDGEEGLNYLCAGYKTFFNHIDSAMRLMSSLLHQGRAPSEASQILADTEQYSPSN